MKNTTKALSIIILFFMILNCLTAQPKEQVITGIDSLITETAKKAVQVLKDDKKTSVVAVYYFMADGKVSTLSDHLINGLTIEIANGIKREKLDVNVVSRQYLDAILKELSFQFSDLADQKNQLSLGRQIGADTILGGTISQVGETYRLNCQVLRVESGLVIGGFIISFKVEADIQKKLGLDKSRVPEIVQIEESSYLPFKITNERVDEIKRWYAVTRLSVKKYTMNLNARMMIPDRVTYKTIAPEKNEKVVNDFIKYLKDPVANAAMQNNSILICGPHLTALLKKSGITASLDFIEVIGPLMISGKQEIIIEYVFKGDSISKLLNLVRNLLLIDDTFNVRKFNARELSWYWSIIAYDIDEPLMMFENRYHSIGIHFTKEGKIFFLDLFEGLEWNEDIKPK